MSAVDTGGEVKARVRERVLAAEQSDAASVLLRISDVRAMLTEQGELRQRVLVAEKAMKTTIEDCRRQGVSLGRMLANQAAVMAEAERDAARREVGQQGEAVVEAVAVAFLRHRGIPKNAGTREQMDEAWGDAKAALSALCEIGGGREALEAGARSLDWFRSCGEPGSVADRKYSKTAALLRAIGGGE